MPAIFAIGNGFAKSTGDAICRLNMLRRGEGAGKPVESGCAEWLNEVQGSAREGKRPAIEERI
ncbi:hypothetical protein, partial [Sinorhizobium meliloti]|uniref:hypothetical protein n=1 Tax=Rhizobium meliloti TaxID=382 RepID=UPI001AEE8C5C